MPTRPPEIVVLKIGGSVLTDLDAYRRCAATLSRRVKSRPHERLLVVVSARFGETDRLQSLATESCTTPDRRLLDLLWSTGEVYSASVLALCLHTAGIDAVGLDVHQCGLRSSGLDADDESVQVNPLPLLYQLRRHPVVVVPGFFATGPGDTIVSLGRGGSDFTAVVLAAALGAERCELIKDVPGYFTKDPNRHADARPLRSVTYETALQMAAAGCDLVQTRALRAAQRTCTKLVIRALADGGNETIVSMDRELAPAELVPACETRLAV